MKRTAFSKALSLFLTIAILLPMVLVFPLPARAATNGLGSAQTSQKVYKDGVYYYIDKQLSYVGNSTFRLTVNLRSSLSSVEQAVRRTEAKNGYFTVDKTGWYLLELWGGRGGNGGDAIYQILWESVVRPGGKGGTNGYVYAKVYLEKGQTLAYSIGTNGAPTLREDNGGGANGEGGEHGANGSYTIGGGGGYSALYFFNEGEFKEEWLTSDNRLNIPESARVSRYIMIAAGGGGGGAGNGMFSENATGSNGTVFLANGGAGGSSENAPVMQLIGSSYPVQGSIFAGRNGSSSGSSVSYIGRGGTNLPGKSPDTALGQYQATDGNDWSGTYTPSLDPGAGGTSDLRGGAGGAGYSGGSGGVMESLITAANVGGGGGGSSFLALKAGDSVLQYSDLDTSTTALLLGAENCPVGVGGAFCHTYLGETDDGVMDTEFLKGITAEGKLSEYFDVFSFESTYGDLTTANGTPSYDEETGVFTVTGGEILPGSMTDGGKTLTLSFILRPKDTFAGGNNIPLLEYFKFSFTDASGEQIIDADPKDETDRVNVPLNLALTTNSIMLEESEDSTHELSDLYVDEHPTFTGGAAPSWEYTFLSSISEYAVYLGKEGAVGAALTGSVAPTETQYYSVVLTATPDTSNGYATVGPRNTGASKFWGIACIAIVGGDILDLGSYMVTANKYLTHDGEAYRFEEELNQHLTSTWLAEPELFTYKQNGSKITYTAEHDGYYYLQAWGAAGGKGGSASATAKGAFSFTKSASGGDGGNGAALNGFVYLHAGDKLTVYLGDNGGSGTSRSKNTPALTWQTYTAVGDGGYGGSAAAITLTTADSTAVDEFILIAGGGGGGGGASAGATATGMMMDSATGSAGTPSTLFVNTYLGSLTGSYTVNGTSISHKGGTGGPGKATGNDTDSSPTCTKGSTGSGGRSYINSTYIGANATEDEATNILNLGATLAEAGVISNGLSGKVVSDVEKYYHEYGADCGSAVQITPLVTEQFIDEINLFEGIETTGTISRYFDIVDVGMELDGVVPENAPTKTVNGNRITLSYDTNPAFSFTYELIDNVDGSTTYRVTDAIYLSTFKASETQRGEYTASGGFSLVLTLKPREGFLGGNDVPVLQETDDPDFSCVTVTQHGTPGQLSKNPQVDYANVEITLDLKSVFRTKDANIIYGHPTEGSVTTGDLYEFDYVWPEEGDADYWKVEFLEKPYLPTETVYSPAMTETYTLGLSLKPLVTEPVALVVGATDGVSIEMDATVFVYYPVDFSGLQYAMGLGDATVLCQTAYTATIEPEDGFKLPQTVDVYVSDALISAYTYDNTTGVLTVDAEAVTGPIRIVAISEELQYTLHYLYTLGTEGETAEHTETYYANDPIDYTQWFDTFVAPAREGYIFYWDWDTSDGNPPEIMPAHDVWAIGSYAKEQHKLTVHYRKNVDGVLQPAAEDYVATVEYGESYAVPSPAIDGYAPDLFNVTGVMQGEDIEVTVTYEQSFGKLFILYVMPNGTELTELRHTSNVDIGDSYEVASPNTVTGYTPDPAVVSGTVESNSSITVYVTYRPNRYEITFEYLYAGGYPDHPTYDLSDATMEGVTSYYAEYDNVYSYDAENDVYAGLPTPMSPGYTFEGWYTESTFQAENLVDGDATVKITEATKLYAKWTATPFLLTVYYSVIYEDGDFWPEADAANLPEGMYIQYPFYIGDDYSIDLTDLTGYSAYENYGLAETQEKVDVLSGTMPGVNVVIYITYEINTYEIRFLNRGNTDVTYPDALTDLHTGVDEHIWQTVYTKHATVPKYTGEVPSFASENYTYRFNGWTTADGVTFGKETVEFPIAVANADYFACYTAFENVAIVLNNDGVTVLGYYTSVQEAVDAAIALQVSGNYSNTWVRLRRNEGTVLDLRNTEVIPTVNIPTSSYTLRFDLNGYTLTSNETVIRNRSYLIISDSVGGGEILAEAEGDIVAVDSGNQYFYIGGTSISDGYRVNITAISENGNATAVYNEYYGTYYGGTLNATAKNGTAYALYVGGSSNYYYQYIYGTALNATSESDIAAKGNAYGIHSRAKLSLYTGTVITATSAAGDAYGVYATDSLYFSNENIQIHATSTAGNAYGVKITGEFSTQYGSIDNPVTVTAHSDAKNAHGIMGGKASGTLYMVVNSTAPQGTATGIKCTASSSNIQFGTNNSPQYYIRAEGNRATALEYSYSGSLYMALTAIGTKEAIGILGSGYTLTFYGGADVTATVESGSAYGVKNINLSTSNMSAAYSITATATTGNAYAIANSGVASFSSGATASATVTTGNAYGCYTDDAINRTVASSFTVSATATEGGSAYGVYSNGRLSFGGAANATAKYAYGAYTVNGIYSSTLSSTARILATNNAGASGVAYGAYTASIGASLLGEAGATVTAEGGEGIAYGVYNTGKLLTNTAFTVTATADGDTYGVANIGGLLYTTGEGFRVTATSNAATAYAMYNNGGSMGLSGLSDSLRYGVITAVASEGNIGYAFYAESGNIYIRGVHLYYKGSADEYARYGNVIICAGYEEIQATDQVTYPNYFALLELNYTMIFIEYDANGNEIYRSGEILYSPETLSITVPSLVAKYDKEGHTKLWDWTENDFSAPEEGDVRYIYSTYTANFYTVTFHPNGGILTGETTVSVQYGTLIARPSEDPTRTGYTFRDWYSDAETLDLFDFATFTMPAYDIYIYAGWNAELVTITFVTNYPGHTIDPIQGYYGDPLTLPDESDLSRPCYYLVGWYTTPEFSSYFGSSTFPEESITLYAKWGTSLGIVVLGATKAYTLNLHVNLELDIGEEIPDIIPLPFSEGQLTYYDATDMTVVGCVPAADGQYYVFRGWYTASGKNIDLCSGIGSWDVEAVDGVIDLYAHWDPIEKIAGAASINDSSDMNTQLNNNVYTFDPTLYNEETGYFYAVYTASTPGVHNIGFLHIMGEEDEAILTSAAARKHIEITVYRLDGTSETVYDENMAPCNSLAEEYFVTFTLDLEAGDTVIMRVQQLEDESVTEYLTTMALVLIETPSSTSIDDVGFLHNATDFIIYIPTEEDVALPTLPNSSANGQFLGWSYKDGEGYGDPTLVMKYAYVNMPELWYYDSDLGVSILQLYDRWSGAIVTDWLSYAEEGRHFNPTVFEENQAVHATIRANGAVSFVFGLNAAVGANGVGSLVFKNGLPAGTILTMLDFDYETGMPTFYTYTVPQSDDGITEVALSLFEAMDGSGNFSGSLHILMFNVSYANTEHSLANERVDFCIDGAETGAFVTYAFLHTLTTDFPAVESTYLDLIGGGLPIPSLTNQGYSANDEVYLKVSIYDAQGNKLVYPAGANFAVNGQKALVYDDFALVKIGTVATAPSSVVGNIDPSTLQYMNFSGTLVYEVIVVPHTSHAANGSYFGLDTYVEARYTQGLRVLETPNLSLYVQQNGSEVSLVLDGLNGAELTNSLSLYVYQYDSENDTVGYTRACAGLFENCSVDQYGRLTFDDGTKFDVGKYVLTISENAVPGNYYIILTHLDKFVTAQITVPER